MLSNGRIIRTLKLGVRDKGTWGDFTQARVVNLRLVWVENDGVWVRAVSRPIRVVRH